VEQFYVFDYIGRRKNKNIAVAVFNFISLSEVNWGGLMAAAGIITLPLLIITLIAQRYIVNGLAAGAVKGLRLDGDTETR
jgi:multiple sugar transport system permease protein